VAHYAFVDENNVVDDVIVGRDEWDLPEGITSWEQYYGDLRGMRCLRTSVNTYAGKHITGKTPFRGNYAIVDGTYDEEKDVFFPPPPEAFPSFILDTKSYVWVAPVPYPEDGKGYIWDEATVGWVEANFYPTTPKPSDGEWYWSSAAESWLPL